VSYDALERKLVHMLGPTRAEALIDDTLHEIGRTDLEDPQDRLLFGHALLRHGGVIEAIGRSIKIQAILEGADESSIASAPTASGGFSAIESGEWSPVASSSRRRSSR
jgi:hypothetical protein